jgi:hypothetical protein
MSRSRKVNSALCVVALMAATAQVVGQETAGAPKATSSIAGRVVAATTGRPVRGATMTLLSWEVMRVAKRVATDEEGRFEFTGLVPGRYQLTSSATGFVAVEFGGAPVTGRVGEGRPIDVREGERFDKADFSLRRPGAIEGRLLDEFGDPAPDLQVQVATVEFVAGRHRLMPVPGRGQMNPTDDKGRFRVAGLPPGDYFLTAPWTQSAERDAATVAFAPTLYPGTTDLASAQPIRVGLGEEMAGLTLSLVPAPMAQVSGRLVDAAGQPAVGAVMMNLSDRSGGALIVPVRTSTRPDGAFTFSGVPPCTYAIQAFGRQVSTAGNLGASEFGWAPVTVNGVDITGLTVRVRQGPAARGRIVLEDDDGTLKPDQVRISGRPVEFDSAPLGGGPSPSDMRPDWTFEVRNLSGFRVVQADVASPDWALERIMLDGRNVTDTVHDFREKDVEGLEVVLTKRAPALGGRVTDRDGRAVGNYSIIVFASDESRWKYPSRFIAMGRPNQDGGFIVRGLPPEDYLVVAIPPVQGTLWQDPEFLATLRTRATAVTLAEGEKKTLELKVMR